MNGHRRPGVPWTGLLVITGCLAVTIAAGPQRSAPVRAIGDVRGAPPATAPAGSLAPADVVTLGSTIAFKGDVRSTAATAATAVGIDTDDRAAVRSALVSRLRPALAVPVTWSGSVKGCKAGKPSARTQSATLTALNVYRGLGRLAPVKIDPALSAKALKAALIMQAQGSLSHQPPKAWKCWTSTGSTAAGHSNLFLGVSGAAAIAGYMDDPGQGNGAAGHRRWIMYPPTATMGSGSTSRANALWVFGDTVKGERATPVWVSWPTPGYFPTQLEPAGRWSLSASDPAVSFSHARVTVRTATGANLKVKQYATADGYGSNTLVWQVSGVKNPSGTTPRRLDVAVTGIRKAGATLTHRYPVRLFNADARLANSSMPRLEGSATVGHELTVDPGTWTPAATGYTYAWYRGKVRLSAVKTSRYTLTSSDAGRKISVKVAAKRGGYADGLRTTAARTVAP